MTEVAEKIAPERNAELNELVKRKYEEGFFTDIESDTLAPGLNEDVVRIISAKKKGIDQAAFSGVG